MSDGTPSKGFMFLEARCLALCSLKMASLLASHIPNTHFKGQKLIHSAMSLCRVVNIWFLVSLPTKKNAVEQASKWSRRFPGSASAAKAEGAGLTSERLGRLRENWWFFDAENSMENREVPLEKAMDLQKTTNSGQTKPLKRVNE